MAWACMGTTRCTIWHLFDISSCDVFTRKLRQLADGRLRCECTHGVDRRQCPIEPPSCLTIFSLHASLSRPVRSVLQSRGVFFLLSTSAALSSRIDLDRPRQLGCVGASVAFRQVSLLVSFGLCNALLPTGGRRSTVPARRPTVRTFPLTISTRRRQ